MKGGGIGAERGRERVRGRERERDNASPRLRESRAASSGGHNVKVTTKSPPINVDKSSMLIFFFFKVEC